MFETAVFRDPLSEKDKFGERTTLGNLAEALLFYDQTHLVLGWASLENLLLQIGYSTFERLLKERLIKATFINEMVAIATGENLPADHEFSFMTIGRSSSGQAWPDRIAPVLVKTGVDQSKARRKAKELLKLMPPSRLSSGMPAGGGVGDLFVEQVRRFPDLTSQATIFSNFRLPLGARPTIGKFQLVEVAPATFRIVGDHGWSAVSDHLKGSRINESPGQSVALAAYSAFVDFALASRFGGDLIAGAEDEALVAEQVGVAMHRRLRNAHEIAQFSYVEFGEGCGVAQAIDSGERTFSEFLELLERGRKFKDMLKNANPSVGLLRAYQDEVAKGSWLNQLLPKPLRFGFVNGVGVLADALGGGGAASIAIGAVDEFILDRIRFGYSPATFVQNKLRPFVGSAL